MSERLSSVLVLPPRLLWLEAFRVGEGRIFGPILDAVTPSLDIKTSGADLSQAFPERYDAQRSAPVPFAVPCLAVPVSLVTTPEDRQITLHCYVQLWRCGFRGQM